MPHVSPDQVMKALRNVDYPASKEELPGAAVDAGASSDVIAALRAIPPRNTPTGTKLRARPLQIRPRTSVSAPGSGLSRARPRRRHGPQRLSERMRDVPKPVVGENETPLRASRCRAIPD